jgi:hypothetical protein
VEIPIRYHPARPTVWDSRCAAGQSILSYEKYSAVYPSWVIA